MNLSSRSKKMLMTVATRRAGFTLAEVLIAMAFMAVVIPVAVRGLQVAGRSGAVAQRKAMAGRIGERLINEIIVTKQWSAASVSGNEKAGPYDFRWTLHNDPWTTLTTNAAVTSTTGINTATVNANNIHELSVDVSFSAQSQPYTVHLSTLVDITQQPSGTATPQLQ